MSRETRVRYGRVDSPKAPRTPKNTLVTQRVGDTVYFGIARCNTVAGDAFKRARGTLIASNRAGLARTGELTESYVTDNGVVRLHESYLRGSVAISEVTALLEYFRNVDGFMYDLALDTRESSELQVG